YLPLLTIIPIFNIVWIFIVDFKGNEWAWQKGDYQDVETFKAVQATWNRAGLFNFIIAIAIFVLYWVFIGSMIASLFNNY
ncbi:ribonuclease G, partial [Levilactobacillus brevis]|nr:ribonuclease G [Levilactobacillus brevis]